MKKGAFAKVLAPIVGKPSQAAKDFANRATDALKPWLEEHYRLLTLDEANFTHERLLEYHLRGDHYIGLSTSLPTRMGPDPPPPRPILANVPAHPLGTLFRAFTDEAALRAHLASGPTFPRSYTQQTQFCIYPAVADEATPSAQDFLPKEVARGSSLLFFTLQELASMTFALLPYAGTKVYEETMAYIDQFCWDILSNEKIMKNGSTTHVAFQRNRSGGAFQQLADQLGLDHNDLSLTNSPTDFANPALFTFPCSLPLYLVDAVVSELRATGVAELYGPGATPFDTDLVERLQALYIAAYEACVQMSRNDRIENRGDHVSYRKNRDDFTAIFTRNKNGTAFLQTYFDLVLSKYQEGTVVQLVDPFSGDGAKVVSSIVKAAVAAGEDETTARNAISRQNEFVISRTVIERKNKKLKQRYHLRPTDSTYNPYESSRYGDTMGQNSDPLFILSSDPDQRRSSEISTPIGIIGRAMLSEVIHMTHIASYHTYKRDFRKLTSVEPPGNYTPLPTPGTTNAPFKKDEQKKSNQGLIDYYVHCRLEFMASYLAGLYEAVPQPMREQLTTFYTSDMFANEFAYYAAAVSNYISTQSGTDEHIEPISGRMSVYKEPEGEKRSRRGRYSKSRFTYMQAVAPESVYYKLESPMLRLIYREYVQQFYTWYVGVARDLDRGRRTITPGGISREGTYSSIASELEIKTGKKSKDADKKRLQSTQAILKQMWPLLKARAVEAVNDGRATSHAMMRELAQAARLQRERLSMVTPMVPFSTTFIDFGALLSDPRKYNLPPSLDSTAVSDFITYLESVYFTSYDMVGALATTIEIIQTSMLGRDELISEFEKKYASFRKTKVANRFTWPATAHLINLFRQFCSMPATLRADLAAEEAEAALVSTTETPRREEDVGAARIAPARTTPIPLAIREEP